MARIPKEFRRARYKAIVKELIGAATFLTGIAIYFQPVGEELFTLFIRFPIVEVNFASALVMIIGAVLWLLGKDAREEIDTQIAKERQNFAKIEDEEKRTHFWVSIAYAGVLMLLFIAMVQNVIGDGFVFKNILMFMMVATTVGIKFVLHSVHGTQE